jgi:hypothetical protein
MPLRSDVEAVRDRSLDALVEAHDHLEFSRQLWRDVLATTRRPGQPLVLSNPVTGSRATGAALLAVVAASLNSYLPSASIQQFVSVAETFLADLVRLWVTAYPFHFRTPVDVQTIITAPDKAAILEAMADVYVGSLAYKTPREWFKQLNAIVALGVPTDAQIDAFAELKATRDVFVHNRGMANETYVRKAGVLARASDGQPIDLPDPYVHQAWRLCQSIVTDVGTAAAARA